MKNSFVNIFVLLLISISISSCSKPSAPDFKKIKNVRVMPKSGNVYTVSADAIYSNPNSVGGELVGMEMDVILDDKKLTHLSQSKDAVILPDADFTVPIVFDVDAKELLDGNKGILQGALDKLLKNKMEIQYVGHLDTKFMGIEFRVPVDYSEDVSVGLNYE